MDELYPAEITSSSILSCDGVASSLQDDLQAELTAVRNQSHKATQRVRTINTGTKGFVLARITDKLACPVQLVSYIFRRVSETRLPCARHLVRIIPIQHTCYPSVGELEKAMAIIKL